MTELKANPERPVTLTYTCEECGYSENITMKFKDHAAWKGGTLIQDALPYLTDNQRELMISRTCGPCFDGMSDFEVAVIREEAEDNRE